MKLGEMLIKRGALTPAQLESALKAQLILGGHLGTALIEQGLVDEETLGETLSMMCGVPYAPPQSFARIAETTIAAITRKVAEEYLAIPLKVEEKFIHVAMVNPNDLRRLDELSFAIGRRVIPWIAPEVRIYQALEDYYGLARRPRFITLSRQLDDARARHTLVLDVHASAHTVRSASVSEPHAPEDPAAADLHDASYGYGKSWQEIADELEKRETAAPAPASPKAAGPSARAPHPSTPEPANPCFRLTLEKLAERFCAAESQDDLARAALDFSAGRAERLLLLVVRGQRATIWHERGFALTNETRYSVGFQVTAEPLFQLLMGDEHYHGAVPPSDDAHAFFRNLSVEAPRDLLLVPVRVNDLLVAMVIADGGRHGMIEGPIRDFVKAFRLFGMAIGLLAMKRKIRDTARPDARVAVATE